MTRPASPAVDDWEIDITQLQIDAKVDGVDTLVAEYHTPREWMVSKRSGRARLDSISTGAPMAGSGIV